MLIKVKYLDSRWDDVCKILSSKTSFKFRVIVLAFHYGSVKIS